MTEKISYRNIEKKLEYLDQTSKKLSLQVIGQSSKGENIYSITVSQDVETYNKSFIQKQYNKMIHHSNDLSELLSIHTRKIPIMITGAIHGFEYNGTEAIINLIDYFIAEDNPDAEEILAHCLLIFIPSANPDGLMANTRFNGNGFDLNRDFITQSQPETKAVVNEIVAWNPMVILDLHGYVNLSQTKLGVIEPCTPPHNPNYHYDLFSSIALQQAEAIEKKIVSLRHTYSSTRYQKMTGTIIPLRDSKEGWDDYGPFTLSSYGLLHGAVSSSIETPNQTIDGTRWLFDAVKEACLFISRHSVDYFSYYHEFHQRTIKGIPPELKKGDFPKGYLLSPTPTSLYSLNKAIRHLTENGIVVKKVKGNFSKDSSTVTKGSYFVSLKQPKGLIANAFLEPNKDLSNAPYKMNNLSTWSLPLLWGFHCIPFHHDIDTFSSPSTDMKIKGHVRGNGPFYKLSGSPLAIIKLVNKLLNLHVHMVRDDKGDYYVNNHNKRILEKTVKSSSVFFESTKCIPSNPPLSPQKIALLKDGGMYRNQSHAGTKQALAEMEFNVNELSPQDIALSGLEKYDTLIIHCNEYIYRLSKFHSDINKPFVLQTAEEQNHFNRHIKQFVEKGGNFIAIGAGGAKLARNVLKLRNIHIHTGGWNENGIVHVQFPESPLSFGYKSLDQGFVYRPVWFTETPEVKVLARFENNPQFFISGFWRQKRETAQGQPVVIKIEEKKIFLIGLELGYKMYPYHLFPILASVIYY